MKSRAALILKNGAVVALTIAVALSAMLQGQFAEAVTTLAAIIDDLPRLGGSNAQREVVEDTFIDGLLSAGRTEEAEKRIRARLGRRRHVLDAALLNGVRPVPRRGRRISPPAASAVPSTRD